MRATVRHKLMTGFALVLFITAIVGLVGLSTIPEADAERERVHERNVVGLLHLSRAQFAVTALATGTGGSEAVVRAALTRLEGDAVSPQTRRALRRVKRAFDEWEAARQAGGPSAPRLARLDRSLLAFGVARAERAERELRESQTQRTSRRALLLGLVAVAIFGGMLIALLAVRDIAGRVKECATFARRIAKGDLSARVTTHGFDALGQLGRDLNAMADELGAQQRDLERRALRDPLTDLLNHRAFQERMYDEIARAHRRDEPLVVCVLDLDHFKAINDTWGHAAGDEALQMLADVLRRELRDEDVIGRLGGDEMAIGLPATGGDEALRVLDRVRTALFTGGLSFPAGRLRTSVGVAELPRDALDLGELLALADAAMYRAKREGGDRACRVQATPAGVARFQRTAAAPTAPPGGFAAARTRLRG